MAAPTRQMQQNKERTAPLRAIIQRDNDRGNTVEVLECGHLHRPREHPVYPERHLEAKRRRCRRCLGESKGLIGPALDKFARSR